jgi:hypothetical protein
LSRVTSAVTLTTESRPGITTGAAEPLLAKLAGPVLVGLVPDATLVTIAGVSHAVITFKPLEAVNDGLGLAVGQSQGSVRINDLELDFAGGVPCVSATPATPEASCRLRQRHR